MLSLLLVVASVFTNPQAPTNQVVTMQLNPPPGATIAHVVVEHDFNSRFYWETIENNCDAEYTLDMRIRAGWALQNADGLTLTSKRWNETLFDAGECVPFDGVWDWAGPSGDHRDYQKLTGTVVDINLAALPGNLLILSNQARTYTDVTITLNVLLGVENIEAGLLSGYITTAGSVVTVTYL